MKIFLIVGKSFSGKDTFLNSLLEDKEFCKKNKLSKIVRTTTRLPREGEVEGKDYYFITEDQYETEYKDKQISQTVYETVYGKIRYIIDHSKLESDKNYITIDGPEMIQPLKELYDKNLYVIFLCPPNSTLFERFSNRVENSKYQNDKYKEIYRRFMNDLLKYGSYSNVYFSRVNSLINVGETVYIDYIKSYMETMCYYNMNENYSMTIISKNGIESFDSDYNAMYTQPLSMTVKGLISLKNSFIFINTEEKTIENNENNCIL